MYREMNEEASSPLPLQVIFAGREGQKKNPSVDLSDAFIA
jgi:hypothetical protein